jgi:ribose/xylose/arabinose/galactoside ABC-type transport system permease subunit
VTSKPHILRSRFGAAAAVDPAARKHAPSTRVGALLRDGHFWTNWTVVLALGVLVVVFSSTSNVFLTGGNINSVLDAAAILAVLSVGQTFVVATAGIDLSIASTLTLAAVVIGQFDLHGWGIGLGSVAALAVGLAVGAGNGLVIAKGRITDFVVTLGALGVAQGLALVLSAGQPVQVFSPALLELATGTFASVHYTVLLALAIALVGHVLLFYTRFGTHLFAIGGDPEAARAMGVAVGRVKVAAYCISGLLAGVAGILLVARIGSAQPAIDTSYVLNSVAAVVLGGVSLFGGRGTIFGPVAGAVLLSALVNGLTLLSVSVFYQPIAVGLVVIASALLMRYGD